MFHVTCSIGLAQYNDDIKDLVAFLELADRALYQAKASGRDRVVQTPMTP
jgi:diguanylate cyclase (GGDEF)-like protein